MSSLAYVNQSEELQPQLLSEEPLSLAFDRSESDLEMKCPPFASPNGAAELPIIFSPLQIYVFWIVLKPFLLLSALLE